MDIILFLLLGIGVGTFGTLVGIGGGFIGYLYGAGETVVDIHWHRQPPMKGEWSYRRLQGKCFLSCSLQCRDRRG